MDKEDVVYMYTMEYNSAIKKNEILPFAATWVDLEGIMLSEISKTKSFCLTYMEYKSHTTYMWNLKKYNKLVNTTKKKQTHRYREQTSGYQWGEGKGEGHHRGLRSTNYQY